MKLAKVAYQKVKKGEKSKLKTRNQIKLLNKQTKYSTAIKRPYISVRYRFIPVQFYRRKSFVINRLNFGEISVKFRSYFGAKYRNYNNEFCTDYFASVSVPITFVSFRSCNIFLFYFIK